MKKIPLTQGKFAIVDDEDFEELNQHKWFAHKDRHSFYARRIERKMHRVIMKAQKGQHVDHINGNGLDNRRCNLRFCTHQQNNMNRKPNTKLTSSQHKGVSWDKNMKKWRTKIQLNKKQIHIGFFDSEIEAAKAYDKKATELFGEFAYLNFPERNSK